MLNAICKGFEELQLLGLVDKKRDFKITPHNLMDVRHS